MRKIFIDYIGKDQIIMIQNPEWENIWRKKLKASVPLTSSANLQISSKEILLWPLKRMVVWGGGGVSKDILRFGVTSVITVLP